MWPANDSGSIVAIVTTAAAAPSLVDRRLAAAELLIAGSRRADLRLSEFARRIWTGSCEDGVGLAGLGMVLLLIRLVLACKVPPSTFRAGAICTIVELLSVCAVGEFAFSACSLASFCAARSFAFSGHALSSMKLGSVSNIHTSSEIRQQALSCAQFSERALLDSRQRDLRSNVKSLDTVCAERGRRLVVLLLPRRSLPCIPLVYHHCRRLVAMPRLKPPGDTTTTTTADAMAWYRAFEDAKTLGRARWWSRKVREREQPATLRGVRRVPLRRNRRIVEAASCARDRRIRLPCRLQKQPSARSSKKRRRSGAAALPGWGKHRPPEHLHSRTLGRALARTLSTAGRPRLLEAVLL